MESRAAHTHPKITQVPPPPGVWFAPYAPLVSIVSVFDGFVCGFRFWPNFFCGFAVLDDFFLRLALARRRLFPSHGMMAGNDWKRPGSGSLQISLGRRGKFPLPVLLLFFSLEVGEEGPPHGLFFSVFLSSPGQMFCTDHFDFYGMRQ